MEDFLNLVSMLQQASDYSYFYLMEVYEDYQLFHLLSLINEEALNQKKLAKKLGMTEPALSMKLKKYEKSNLIFKKKSMYDKRNYILALTDSGAQILNSKTQILNIRSKDLFSKFDQEELDALKALLNKIYQ